MTQRTIADVTIECLQGDIANQPDMDAIVNAANAQLRPGGGVAGAIHRAAGPGLDEECRPLAPIKPGQAVITSAHKLPNKQVIHCLGPIYGVDEPSDRLLADCYRNVLQLAEQHGLGSIAVPAISTGAFDFPLEAATRIALGVMAEETQKLKTLKWIRCVLFQPSDLEVYERVLDEIG